MTLVSGAIWLLTLPLVMARFHIFNPVAVLINTAVWLPMAGALVSGLALLLCSMIPGPLAAVCAVFCNWQLAAVEWLVRFGEHVPYGHSWVPGPAEWWLIGLYAGLAVFAAFPRLRPPLRWRLALLGAWTAAGVIIPWWTTDRHGLRCTFLSVGHGESIVLELPDGRTVLYDAGRMAGPTSCCRIVSGYLWSRGLTHIDAVVLSHADTDHYNALPELLERFSVGTVYVSPVMFDEQNASIRFLREAIERAKVPIRVIACGDRLSGGPGCRLEVLHPPPQGLPSTSNANSIVLSVEYEGRRVLLAGRSTVARLGRRAGRASAALRHVVGATPRQPNEHARAAFRLEYARPGRSSAPTTVTTPARLRRSMRSAAACCTRPIPGP